MPELPEVETIARGVDERLAGTASKPPGSAKSLSPSSLLRSSWQKSCPAAASNASIASANNRLRSRRRPGPRLQWIVHLGMTGRLLVADPETPVPPHTHGILHLLSGKELRFVDPRRFGRMELHGRPTKKTTRICGHGPGTFQHLAGRVRRALPAAPHVHQGRPAKPKAAARGRQYLCRREPLPRRHPAAQDGPAPEAGRT